ncbi:hypothetical protein QYE76_066083 [Lolium multiflorum]|uniref:Uncharacterized protein n=2 Tax=Lolium multiflorum TaxID=4521 RepID=A0AAD8SAW1_LOLMU|nr:hypothetical protein QYE76_066083 [Lolium multiflorum]
MEYSRLCRCGGDGHLEALTGDNIDLIAAHLDVTYTVRLAACSRELYDQISNDEGKMHHWDEPCLLMPPPAYWFDDPWFVATASRLHVTVYDLVPLDHPRRSVTLPFMHDRKWLGANGDWIAAADHRGCQWCLVNVYTERHIPLPSPPDPKIGHGVTYQPATKDWLYYLCWSRAINLLKIVICQVPTKGGRYADYKLIALFDKRIFYLEGGGDWRMLKNPTPEQIVPAFCDAIELGGQVFAVDEIRGWTYCWDTPNENPMSMFVIPPPVVDDQQYAWFLAPTADGKRLMIILTVNNIGIANAEVPHDIPYAANGLQLRQYPPVATYVFEQDPISLFVAARAGDFHWRQVNSLGDHSLFLGLNYPIIANLKKRESKAPDGTLVPFMRKNCVYTAYRKYLHNQYPKILRCNLQPDEAVTRCCGGDGGVDGGDDDDDDGDDVPLDDDGDGVDFPLREGISPVDSCPPESSFLSGVLRPAEAAVTLHMASPINFNQFLEKEKLKSNGSNFTDWFRHVRIFLNGGNLQYVLDAPLGDPPAETETDEVKNVYATRKTRYSQVQCAILCSLEADLQKRFEHHDPHELINELKTIFETHAAVECYEASKHFFSCMMEEGSSVSEHMLAMTGHAKKLSDLGIVIPNRLGINRVLQSLPPSYKNFVMNYNMQNMNKELPELFAMLKSAEIEIKKEHQVLMVNKTTSFKKQGKSKGKNKKSGKKAATPPVKPKTGPKPDAECYYCKEKGHWKRNCSKYLADLKSGLVKKKKEGISDIHVIDVYLTGSRTSTWVFDTGSVAHICNSKQELKNKRRLLKDEVTMRVGNGSKVDVIVVGTLPLHLPSGLVLSLNNCYFVPALSMNIISGSCLMQDGYSFKSENNGCSIFMNNIFYGRAPEKNGLFLLDLDSSDTHIHNIDAKRIKLNDNSTYMWHCRLGHIGVKRMKKLHTDGLLESLDFESLDRCEACLMGKMTKTPFSGMMERATDLLEIIHTDVCGPMSVASRGGYRYVLTFTDDLSRYGYIYLMKHKSETFEKFKEFQSEVENQRNKKIKFLRSDRGGEYLSYEFGMHLKKCGILSQLTPPGTPQRNVWGCEAYVKKLQPDKLEPKAEKCVFIGYPKETIGYTFYHRSEGKIFVAKNGTFLEKEFLTKEVTGRKVELDEIEESLLVDQSSAVPEDVPVPPAPATEEANDNDHETSNEITTEPRRSTRERATPDWYDPCLNVMIVDNNDEDPATYEEAMMSPDSNKWQEAMKSEMGSMYDNKVWTLVDLPDSRKAVENKWIFKRKTDADGNITVYKARLVAKGFRQIQGVDYDETFSPVAKLKSVRILLAIAAFFDYEIWQMDVKTAFLNGDIEEELYMVQPKGFVDPKNDDKVCKLQRSIYGLKQASRSWNRRFDKVIKDFGFIQCHGEACIYKKVSGSSVAFLILYVDDILLIGNDIELLSSVKGYLNNSFSMKDLGEASYILGIKIYRDRSRRLIGLSQSTYLDKILKKFRMDESKKGFLPMLPGKVLSKTQGPATAEERERMSQIPYASAVGSIMYAMLCTRPDIAHAVSLTSRYQSDPGMEHWTAVKNILKYLKRTKDMFLCYGGDQELVVTSYTNASWNTDPDDSKSQSGYVFILNGAAVSWASSKQCTVAKSSTESEYIAASEASSEAVWMKRFIVELGVVPSALDPLVIYCDNMGAIANAQEPRSHKRLKHIKLRYHSIREYIEDGEVKICKVHTDLNVADPLTKALPRAKHDQHQNAMGVSLCHDIADYGNDYSGDGDSEGDNGLEYEKRDTILDDTLFGFFSEEASMVLSMSSARISRYKIDAKEDMIRNNRRQIRCPCRSCKLERWINPDSGQLEEHLLRRGFMQDNQARPAPSNGAHEDHVERDDYHHEEDYHHADGDYHHEQEVGGEDHHEEEDAGGEHHHDEEEDSGATPLISALRDSHVQDLLLQETSNDRVAARERAKLSQMEKDGMTPIFPGCRPQDTRLHVTLDYLQMKTQNKWTDSSFSKNLKFWHDRLPEGNTLPSSTEEAKKVVCPLDLPHEKYHACINDCVIYRCEYKDRTTCPVCGHGRYKVGNKKVPRKVVWYFPITPRLQRYFVDPKEAKLMQWHAERQKPEEDPEMGYMLTHPSDAGQWQALDIAFPRFGGDARNIRLGMSTDGLNPFGNQSSTHSTWPVFVWPYNLPPWLCTKQRYIHLSILIQGPKQPGVDMHLYLGLLKEELDTLWKTPPRTWDAYTRTYFDMRAALITTVTDYPGYAYVSAQVGHGFNGCVKCMDDTPHLQLPRDPGSSKTVYPGARRWLRLDHPWRKRGDLFNGKDEPDGPPRPRSGAEIDDLLKNWKECPAPGKKRPKPEPLLGVWKARSVFHDLEYWKVLHTPHSLDVMHITKNVTESLLGTLCNSEKSKDGPKARYDLKHFGIRKDLQAPDTDDDDDDDEQTEGTQRLRKRAKKNAVQLPAACFTTSPEELEQFFRYLDVAKKRFTGMKSHDCHVLMTQILPVAIRGIMDEHVRDTLFGLCNFFDVITRKSIGVRQLKMLQDEIVVILCELEIYFPPAFCDICVHLLLHVVEDIKQLGPTFLHNMMPFERQNGVMKGYVRNRARPDASMAKGFLTYECISFCQNYLSTEDDEDHVGLPPRTHLGRLAGVGHREGYRSVHVGIENRRDDFERAHRVALQHLKLTEPFVQEHKSMVEQNYIDMGRPRKMGDVTKKHNSSFTRWFKQTQLAEAQRNTPSTEDEKLIYTLSQGPAQNLRTYQGYDINGYRFYTEEKDRNSENQNSGVTMLSYADDETNVKERFFGRIEEIWELNYCGETVPMFRVRWAKKVEKEGRYFTTMVIPDAKSKNASAKNEPWVLGSQVDQCFFITDPSRPSRVVVRRGKRSIIGMQGDANEEDLDKNGDPKMEEEFDRHFDMPTTSKVRRKTSLPSKGCPFTRRNLKVAGIKYSTANNRKGKKIAKRR